MKFRQFLTHNNWWGKFLGAFFGYLMAGSAGAFIGILIGNFFDRGLAAHLSKPHATYHDEKRLIVQKVFFEATFTIMGNVAKADGRVSENELQMARVMMEEMRLGREQKLAAKRFFSAGKAANFNIDPILSLLKTTCQDNPELLKLFLDIQYRFAQVDGLSEPKLLLLDSIFRRMGFAALHEQYRFYEDFSGRSSSRSRQYSSNDRYQSSSAQDTLTLAYALLEINAQANKQEVKRAYRRLISRNHPDKLIAQGLPEEMIKLANAKTQKITKAYEQICASKGW